MTEENYKEQNHQNQGQGEYGGAQAPGNTDLVKVSEVLPDNLVVIPLQNRPIFPGIMIPLTFPGDRYAKAIKEAYENGNQIIGVALIKEEDTENFFNSEKYTIGTAMKIFRVNQLDEQTIQVFAQGVQRFEKVRQYSSGQVEKWTVKYHYPPEGKPDEELKAYTMSVISSVKELLNHNQIFQEQLKMIANQMTWEKPHQLMDMVASVLTSSAEKLQDLLETFDLYKRAEKLLILLKEEIELSQLQDSIKQQIEEKVNKQQKEFFLREQLKVIKKELGIEKDDKTSEVEKIKDKMKDLELTEEASKVINQELEKLQTLEPGSPEFQVTRSYLQTLTDLPWGKYTDDKLDINLARKVLDEDHYGLQDVKQRILEFISTLIKRGVHSGSIVCLVGPPGVGKTSVGRSIARTLGREFYRFSVGGMRDEAEIKGHRRTYIGAMPGKIMQSLKQTQSANPVIMLDEIDKIGTSFQGDPASALLEVLDPEQNKDFLDHYLDVRFDLSKILFITTANQLDTIPRALIDRMEIIKLPGYILEEKVQIAKKFLIPKNRKELGLKSEEIRISEQALKKIIDGYAREAGVRNLEKQLKKLMRLVTLRQAEQNIKSLNVSVKNLEKYLGQPIFTQEEVYSQLAPGMALGLAWTSMGGSTLYIEASSLKQKQTGFKQTGQLGKVMQESSEIAFSYVKSLLCSNDGYDKFFDEHFVHLHVPAGATPKDGPSAGITMASALYSLAAGKPLRSDVAMSGEITLTGKILPVGGIREKTIAARRVGVMELIFPQANRKNYHELPDYIREGINVHFVDNFTQVLDVVFHEE